jgi:serine protease Do
LGLAEVLFEADKGEYGCTTIVRMLRSISISSGMKYRQRRDVSLIAGVVGLYDRSAVVVGLRVWRMIMRGGCLRYGVMLGMLISMGSVAGGAETRRGKVAPKAKASSAIKVASKVKGVDALPAGVPKPSVMLQKILDGRVPSGVAQIKAMQDHIQAVSSYVTRATVGVRVGRAGGSGVVVTPDGYVLTCAHVTRRAGVPVTIMFSDGTRARGKTLGANSGVDAGLIKITDKPKSDAGWPHCRMGKSADLKRGQWCIAAGHSGGFRANRTPPVRLGRVLRNTSTVIVTDCTIVSGDSGGPLFDASGKVIGISSRIAGPLDANLHVPVDAYTKDWARLVKSETWDPRKRGGGGAYLGVQGDREAPGVRIAHVLPSSAAEKAGVKAGDIVKKFDGKDVKDFPSLVARIAGKKPGDKVKITVLRDKKTLTLDVTLGKRGG